MSAPNRYGSNLTKSLIVMPIGSNGAPVDSDAPSSVEIIVDGEPVSPSNPLPIALGPDVTGVNSITAVAGHALDLNPGSGKALNLNQGVDFEFTGTPLFAPVFSGIAPCVEVPVATSPARAVYTPTPGVSVGLVNYNENLLNTPGIGLVTVKVWNVVHSQSGLAFDSCSKLTSIDFPVLETTGALGIGTNPVLTTLSIPVLRRVFGNFNPGVLASLTTISAPELVDVKAGFAPATMVLLTTLSAPKLRSVGGNFAPTTMAALTTLSMPLLELIGANFTPGTMALVTTWNFPILRAIGANFAPTTFAALTSLTMPELLTIGSTFQAGNYAPTTMALLTTLTAAKLTDIWGTFAPTTMAALTTLSFPLLARITGAVSAASMASLTTISMAGMITYTSTITYNSGLGNVTTVTLGTIGTLKAINGATINISGQKLTVANVNAILALLISLDGTNGTTLWGTGKTINVSGGTSGAPSGQGITDKATLITRGATVTTN